jgi:hypothetical protein
MASDQLFCFGRDSRSLTVVFISDVNTGLYWSFFLRVSFGAIFTKSGSVNVRFRVCFMEENHMIVCVNLNYSLHGLNI